MFIEEIHTDDVNEWIEDDAQTAYDLYLDHGKDNEQLYNYAAKAAEDTPAYLYNALAIIAWSGCTFDLVHGECSCFDDSPAAIYEHAVYSRLVELVEEEAED